MGRGRSHADRGLATFLSHFLPPEQHLRLANRILTGSPRRLMFGGVPCWLTCRDLSGIVWLVIDAFSFPP